jgi:hypothetical protein
LLLLLLLLLLLPGPGSDDDRVTEALDMVTGVDLVNVACSSIL